MTSEAFVSNPYVGPRTFSYAEHKLFFGREREARDLLARVLSERLLLFYAQSGAGKSSLLHTRLIPQLHKEKGFGVLPVGRVSGELPLGVSQVNNIFIFNLLVSIDEGKDPARLARVTLSDFLARLVYRDKHWVYDSVVTPAPPSNPQRVTQPYVLIVDQFEEIFTCHLARWQEREDFFRQVNQAMQADPNLWVVLTLREDYVAALDPYASLLTDRLRGRYYMERMDVVAALDAIQEPARAYGRPFAPGVAEALVKDLSRIKMLGQAASQSGQYVEPVQLQVVCYQLWENIKRRPVGPITREDLIEAGNLDSALGKFYEDAIAEIYSRPELGVTEQEIRDWFSTSLITTAGTRGMVFRDESSGYTADMPNTIVDLLTARFLLRTELRAGGMWVELVHDGLIEPIRRANLAWYQKNPLIMLAHEWDKADRADSKLLEGQRLQDALASNGHSLGTLVDEFLLASSEAQEAKDREQKRAQQQLELQHEKELANERAEAAKKLAAEQTKRANERAETAKTLKLLAGALAVAAAIAFLSLWFALKARQEAIMQSVHLLANEAQNVIMVKPQLSLLLAAEAIHQSPTDAQGRPTVTETLVSLQQALMMTGGIPLRAQNQDTVTDTVVVATSPNGPRLAAGGQDGRVHLWQFAADHSEASMPVSVRSESIHDGPVTAIAFSPDNRWLVSGGQDGIIGVLDLKAQEGSFMKIPLGQPSGQVLALAFHPSEPWLAVSTTQGAVQRIDLAEPTRPKQADLLLVNSDEAVVTLAFSPEGRWLATVGLSDTLRLWPLTSLMPLSDSRLFSKGKNGVIAFSPDGRWLVAANRRETEAKLFDINQQNPIPFALRGHQKGVQAISFSPDGTKLAIGSGDGTVHLWPMSNVVEKPSTIDTEAPTPLPKPTSGNAQVTPTPETPASPAEAKPLLPDIEPQLLPAHEGAVSALALLKSDQTGQIWLVTSGEDRLVKVWPEKNFNLKTPQYALYGPDGAIVWVAFGSQPALLYTRSDDGTVRAWDLSAPRAPERMDDLTRQELQHWMAEACRRAGRSLTPPERGKYLGNVETLAYCDH